MNMFCYQCEQTAKGTGCTVHGVCGKSPQVSALIDLTIYAAKDLARHAHLLRKKGVRDHEADILTIEALFSTVTNVNFDPARYESIIQKITSTRDRLRAKFKGDAPATEEWKPAKGTKDLIEQGLNFGILDRKKELGDEIVGLQELLTYGLKGMAAYAYHAQILGKEDDNVYEFFHEGLNFLTEKHSAEELTGMVLKCGEVNLKVMCLLDAANTDAYGHPTSTKVRITPVKGKAILVSGHDLKDLEELLKQTQSLNINVYTHGEMLPAHGYPGLKKYSHLVGNYGGAWQDQQKEFDEFPGAILMTTNCLQKPRETYKARIFTSGLVAWTDVHHIGDRNFAPLIEAAISANGFESNSLEKTITVGFGHNAVLGIADKVVEEVKNGAMRHFFLIGGCDGAKPGRNYFTEFAEKVPKDCAILTLACGKYRFNKKDFGYIDGIPRLLDCGQCNDAYSAIQIALSLSKAFNCGINELPLSFILSWYEQKAVVILLTLLHLGIKNMRIGPSLPAFITPTLLKTLSDKFNLMSITSPDEDLESILGAH